MSDETAVFGVGAIFGFLLGCLMMFFILTSEWETAAIERGFGLYCPDTGAWAWKGECGK